MGFGRLYSSFPSIFSHELSFSETKDKSYLSNLGSRYVYIHIVNVFPIGSMGLVYLPTNLP